MLTQLKIGAFSAMLLASQAAGPVPNRTVDMQVPAVQSDTIQAVHSYDVTRFELPEQAKLLVVVEGTGKSTCRVAAYEKQPEGWSCLLETEGHMGRNSMSNDRTEGDKTTPVGVFQLNTPFGQSEKLEGFPDDYIRVDASYTWEDDSNRLVQYSGGSGERVGTAGYAGYYDYALDMGYNRNAIAKKGSALFIHCEGAYKDDTSGCVAVPREDMIRIMQLYGMAGNGDGYIALAPEGYFEQVYDSYGTNDGLSPAGYFGR